VTANTFEVPVNPAPGDLVPLLFWARADRTDSLQAQVHRLINGESVLPEGPPVRPAPPDGAPAEPWRPPHSSTYGGKDAWRLPEWTNPEDRPAAAWIFDVLGPNQRRVLAQLLAAGPDGVWTTELRLTCGYEEVKSMSGVFKAIGGRFRSVGRKPLWRGGPKDAQRGQRLSVPDGPAAILFQSVIAERYPQVAAEFGL
jgi:hypothetical protein